MCQAIADIRQEGIEQGAEQTLLSNLRSLMETAGWSAQHALDMLRVPKEDQPRYLAMLGA